MWVSKKDFTEMIREVDSKINQLDRKMEDFKKLRADIMDRLLTNESSIEYLATNVEQKINILKSKKKR